MKDFLIGAGIGVLGWLVFSMPQTESITLRSRPQNLEPPRIVEDCGNLFDTFAGQYDPNTNTIALCSRKIPGPAYRRFVLAHEYVHWYQHREGQHHRPTADLEFDADRRAIDTLLAQGDCAAIAAYAANGPNSPNYLPGVRYARELRDRCRTQTQFRP